MKAAKSVDKENVAVSKPPCVATLGIAFIQRENLSVRKRFFIMKRDSFACVLCAASGQGVRLEIDHRIHFSRGGDDSIGNLQTLCFNCNRGKRNSRENLS